MLKLMQCGICCSLLSIWGIIQLLLMGIFYHIESPILHEYMMPDVAYDDYDDLIQKTKESYAAAAINSFGAAVIYFVSLLISIGCIFMAKRKQDKIDRLMADDEYFCDPHLPPPPREVKAGQVVSKKEKKKLTAEAWTGQNIAKYTRRLTMSH